MGMFYSVAGMLHIRLTSADIPGLLSMISTKNIALQNVEYIDNLTINATVFRRDYRSLWQIIERRGDKLEIIRLRGLFWNAAALLQRPVLMAGMTIFAFLALYLPSRILFVNVEGNNMIATREILEAAGQSGITFFSSRRDVRSEKVKNALLERIPELQWVGVNTAGCVATISVTEKSVAQQTPAVEGGVCSIVAARDGVIWECTVTNGNPLCYVGQAVKAGQILVSGYTDCGIAIKATRAEAEIYAQTLRNLDVVTPTNTVQRSNETQRQTRYSLKIGKNLIKLFKGSGISDTTCVKMYEEYYLTLPGGFQLPVAVVRETLVCYETQDVQVNADDRYSWMELSAERYLHSQMIAGQILDRKGQLQVDDGLCRFSGRYACLEMIGRVKEEIVQR